ncbi:hypothetical protein YC2023_018195 [Brassica napus]
MLLTPPLFPLLGETNEHELSVSEYVRFRHHITLSHHSMSFCYWSLIGMRGEPLVGKGMSSDTTAKENVSVVDSSLTDWKQDIANSDDSESSGDRKPSNAVRGHFLGSKNKSKPGYQTRYFIIKSLNYDIIQLSVERGIWATQVMNEPILEGAFHVRFEFEDKFLKEPGNERYIIGNIPFSAFYIIFPIVNPRYVRNGRQKQKLSVWKFVICVCDQPRDEPILANQMVSDRSKIGGYEQRTYRTIF